MENDAMMEAFKKHMKHEPDSLDSIAIIRHDFTSGWKACHQHLLERLRSDEALDCVVASWYTNGNIQPLGEIAERAVEALIAMLGGKEG